MNMFHNKISWSDVFAIGVRSARKGSRWGVVVWTICGIVGGVTNELGGWTLVGFCVAVIFVVAFTGIGIVHEVRRQYLFNVAQRAKAAQKAEASIQDDNKEFLKSMKEFNDLKESVMRVIQTKKNNA